MQSTVMTATIRGVEALPVEVQADVSPGLPSFAIVGLPDAAVQEARERVRSAIRAAGLEFPGARVTINLAPAPLRKHGTGFDLPIAIALLTATRQVADHVADGATVVGELALDGSVRPVPGMLAHAYAAAKSGCDLMASSHALDAAAVIGSTKCRVIDHLAVLRCGSAAAVTPTTVTSLADCDAPDLSDVAGHSTAKRALEIAAAGGHNVLFIGPPGSGKTMLARRLGGILPPLSRDERVSTALVHSVAGLDERPVLQGRRPFRTPHHSTSIAGLVGGGSPARPGEVSLAHNGVLFLDELPEFGPSTLQALRQPLEDGSITVVRAEGCVTYPARVTLIAAMNPCPCGYLGDPVHSCKCTPAVIDRYLSRIGGPLLDRIDLRVHVGRVDPSRIIGSNGEQDASPAVAARVCAAREFALTRLPADGNPTSPTVAECRLSADARTALEEVAASVHLSGRGVARTVRVARTIADLSLRDTVSRADVMEAITYRLWEAR